MSKYYKITHVVPLGQSFDVIEAITDGAQWELPIDRNELTLTHIWRNIHRPAVVSKPVVF